MHSTLFSFNFHRAGATSQAHRSDRGPMRPATPAGTPTRPSPGWTERTGRCRSAWRWPTGTVLSGASPRRRSVPKVANDLLVFIKLNSFFHSLPRCLVLACDSSDEDDLDDFKVQAFRRMVRDVAKVGIPARDHGELWRGFEKWPLVMS